MTKKLKNNYSWREKFFGIKNYYVPIYRSLQLSKDNIQHLWVIFTLRDPDPLTRWNPSWIRIRNPEKYHVRWIFFVFNCNSFNLFSNVKKRQSSKYLIKLHVSCAGAAIRVCCFEVKSNNFGSSILKRGQKYRYLGLRSDKRLRKVRFRTSWKAADKQTRSYTTTRFRTC